MTAGSTPDAADPAAAPSDALDGSPRVALVLATSTGGIGRHVASLARGLVARGATVTVLAPPSTLAQFDFAGAATAELDIPTSLTAGDVKAVTALRRLLREAEPDVLHAHGLRAGLVAGLARTASLPLVVTWHNAVLGGGARATLLRLGERYVARTADVTLGASQDLVARAASLGARDARLGAVAAPRLPPPTRTRDEVRADLGVDDRPLIVSVGRLHPQKGYEVLVAAAARWRSLQPVPAVVIAGVGPSYRALAVAISQQRAPVSLLGQRDDVADLLGAADLAVVTSVWEARQLFAQEALGAGVALVATEVGGIPELIGDAAVLIPPGEVDALDSAVRELLKDPERRQRYADAGLARAATWPTEADTVAQVAGVYAELYAPERAAVTGADDGRHGPAGTP